MNQASRSSAVELPLEPGQDRLLCRLCGGCEVRPLYAKPYGLIVRCGDCNALLLNRPAGSESNTRAQDEVFDALWIENRVRKQKIAAAAARCRLAEVRRYCAGGRLLEIGPGGGDLLAAAARQSFRVTGVDSCPEVRQHIAARWGLSELYDSLEALPDSNGSFDVVVMSHVLEHLYDPAPALHRIYSLLRPRGILYVAVPNLDGWMARLLGSDWPILVPYHASYFSFRALSRLLTRTGFSALRRGYSSRPTVATLLFLFAKFKILRRTTPLPEVLPGAQLTAPERLLMQGLHLAARGAVLLLEVLLYPLGRLEVRLGKSDELVVVAEKGVA